METSDILNKAFSISLFSGMATDNVMCSVASYASNGTLAVQLFSRPDFPPDYPVPADPKKQYCEPYGTVTVNLPESGMLPYNVQFVDENNLPGIGAWLQKNGIAKPAGYLCPSGYCLYEAYSFNLPAKDLKEVMDRRQQLGTSPMENIARNSIKLK